MKQLKTAAKKSYYERQLKSAANNPKNTWDILRELLPDKKRDMTPYRLKFNNMLISDKVKIAETFNNFFANVEVGHKISESVESTVSHSFYVKNSVASSIILSPPTPSELAAEIKKCKVYKATSDKQISTKFLIIAADVISPYLVYLVNFMFSNGIFPDVLKIAKVFPLYKSGSYQSVENYRPISLLSPFSKIIEKLIKSKLISFLNKNKLLY